jgi:hypothetical protein
MDDNKCLICGDDFGDKCTHTLTCNHKFHYECLYLSFKQSGQYHPTCPFRCNIPNNSANKLPLVNGLKKINNKWHDLSKIDEFENIPCKHILKRGKRIGEKCGNNCQLGSSYCGRHIKSNPI